MNQFRAPRDIEPMVAETEQQAAAESELKEAARKLISTGYSPDDVVDVIIGMVEDEL